MKEKLLLTEFEIVTDFKSDTSLKLKKQEQRKNNDRKLQRKKRIFKYVTPYPSLTYVNLTPQNYPFNQF